MEQSEQHSGEARNKPATQLATAAAIIFRIILPKLMDIKDRYLLHRLDISPFHPPAKVYVFSSFKPGVDGSDLRERTNIHIWNTYSLLNENAMRDRIGGYFGSPLYQFLIVMPYEFAGQNGGKVLGIDIFAARQQDWNQSPFMYDGYTFENNSYIPKEKGVTCEDGLIILGSEGELRKKSRDLREYLSSWPEL
jgi:hypothetical protein